MEMCVGLAVKPTSRAAAPKPSWEARKHQESWAFLAPKRRMAPPKRDHCEKPVSTISGSYFRGLALASDASDTLGG